MKEYIPQAECTVSIDRHGENDIVLRGSRMSRHHACFIKEGENLIVTGKGKKNETIVKMLQRAHSP